ncbi:hypothetical protein NPIL_89961 [Nephila pilipes]|uniref:Uncharacterized protein n=1 Tax=Nephila pilipes TaxID=299642 RepID=A0A8X6T8W9_NEPPI|nr:hypothetical protein NPIL_89961 [Nephila pilipes]
MQENHHYRQKAKLLLIGGSHACARDPKSHDARAAKKLTITSLRRSCEFETVVTERRNATIPVTTNGIVIIITEYLISILYSFDLGLSCYILVFNLD